jgi:putative ABC transport system permease protein
MSNLRFAIRILERNPLLLYISVPGLAVGLCAVLLLVVYLNYELSFDRHFPTNDRVLRLCNTEGEDKSRTLSISLRTAYTQLPAKVPEVEKAVQLYPGWQSTIISEKGIYSDLTLLYADPEFFDVFGLKLLQGNTSDALFGKSSIVLTKSTAEKLFGPGDCLGKSFKLEKSDVIVSGVISDMPKTTHFKFDMLMSLESNDFITRQGSLEFRTYYLIKKGASIEKARQNIAAANDELMIVWKSRGPLNKGKTETTTELLRDIHLHTKAQDDQVPRTNLSQLYIIIGIALFIFLIALVNFINIYLLHGEKRIAEIASRKVAGASRGMLSVQFYTETFIIAVIALLLGLGMAILAQPSFAKMINLPLTVSDIITSSGVISIMIVLVTLVIISGSYPSYFLSGINTVTGLKGKHRHFTRSSFSKMVVFIQFFITVLLLCSLVVTRAQIRYMKNVPLGFGLTGVMMVNDLSDETSKNAMNIKMELEKLPFVKGIGLSQHEMGRRCSGQWIALFTNRQVKPIKEYRVLSGFCETMRLQLIEGGFFNREESGQNEIILNEAAIRMLGIEYSPGMKVLYKDEPAVVTGIVKDFYYDGYAGNTIDPLVIKQVSEGASTFYIRTEGTLSLDQQKQVVAVFKQFDKENVPTFIPLGEIYKAKFEKDEQVFNMVSWGTYLAILLSFVGILSLSVLNVDRRTKEIGIRKVAGSSEAEIIANLLAETLLLITIASLFAFGVSYYLLLHWLSHFALKISLHAGYFIISGLLAFVIVLLAVSWQSWKAATRNPVEALRYE